MKKIDCLIVSLLIMTVAMVAGAEDGLHWKEADGTITLYEDDAPVFVFQDAFVEPPPGVKAMERRRGYIHPLYGLDGELMTEDFPSDHYHHRGIFWAWPDSTVGGKSLNIWELSGTRSHPMFTDTKEIQRMGISSGDDIVTQSYLLKGQSLHVMSHWIRDEEPDTPIIQEMIYISAYPKQNDARAIDFDLNFTNICDEEVVIRGALTDNKGYGGFGVRPNSERIPFKFTSRHGQLKGEHLEHDSPWVDISYPLVRKGDEKSGYAIFQHPDNPGFPHPGWLIRMYGFLGQSWPHRAPLTLQPGDSFRLRYRLYVHRGDAEEGKVKEAFEEYIARPATAGVLE